MLAAAIATGMVLGHGATALAYTPCRYGVSAPTCEGTQPAAANARSVDHASAARLAAAAPAPANVTSRTVPAATGPIPRTVSVSGPIVSVAVPMVSVALTSPVAAPVEAVIPAAVPEHLSAAVRDHLTPRFGPF